VTYDDLKRTFDVFIQVLLSQYLNSEFLLKIKELNDEYFKPSIELMDTILNEKYDPFDFHLSGWNEQLTKDVDTWEDVLEEIYEIYKHLGKKVAPEIRLVYLLIM
jgi:hypothetical protein